MPNNFHPIIREIQEVRESSGNVQVLDSAGMTQIKADETGGRPKLVPKNTVWYEGKIYTPGTGAISHNP